MNEANGNSKKVMRIKPIENGIVVDHLLQHTGLFILNLLDYTQLTVTPGLNYKSDKLSELYRQLTGKDGIVRKDIIYMEGGELTPDQQGAIAIVSPTATINYVEDGKVVRKVHPVPTPSELGDIVVCSNPNCTTVTEGGPRRFRVIQAPTLDDVFSYTHQFKVQCNYCEKQFFGPLVRFYTGQTLRDIREGEGRFFVRK